jgi:selenide,water dikinase
MGGKPLVALNIAMFPHQPEFFPSLTRIMQGGIDKMTEAGVSIIGGHTIRDKEPKYGFSVMGVIHPDKIFDNSKARPGDALILTKKIGTGIISTGVKAGKCSDEVIEEFTRSMAALNKRPAEIMIETGVSTATDITGFGLIGHLNEVLSASDCSARLHAEAIPFFDEARRLADIGIIPGGTRENAKIFDSHVSWGEGVSDVEKILMSDAQTSGGLLIFVPDGRRKQLMDALERDGVLAAYIGDIVEAGSRNGKRIFLER